MNIPNISFKEFSIKYDQNINELAKAVEGDLEDYEVDDYNDEVSLDQKYDKIYTITKSVIDNQWIFIDYISDKDNIKYKVYHNKYMPDSYILTSTLPVKEKDSDSWYYKIIGKLSLDKQQKLEAKLHISNLYRVKEVIVIPDVRGRTLTKNLYKYLVKTMNLTILGDSEQYFGARKLWTRLSKDFDIVVDIVDIETGEYIQKNATIFHGELDGDFDKRIWSRDEDKLHIRTLLRDIN